MTRPVLVVIGERAETSSGAANSGEQARSRVRSGGEWEVERDGRRLGAPGESLIRAS